MPVLGPRLDGALKALLANPLVRNWEIARPLLDELLVANQAHLPRFAIT